jgi:hypothetical protein
MNSGAFNSPGRARAGGLNAQEPGGTVSASRADIDLLNNKNLVLTGFMGTGKTTIGQEVARRLGRPFLDMDAEIEARASKSIPHIFAEDGEAAIAGGGRSAGRDRTAAGPTSRSLRSDPVAD